MMNTAISVSAVYFKLLVECKLFFFFFLAMLKARQRIRERLNEE